MSNFDELFIADSQPMNEDQVDDSRTNGSENFVDVDYNEGDIDLAMDEDGDRVPIAVLEFANGLGQGSIGKLNTVAPIIILILTSRYQDICWRRDSCG